MVSLCSSRHVSNLEVSVQRHICSYPSNSPQVTSFCVFQCLVWLLDRSEVMGSGLFWFGSIIAKRPIFKKGKKGSVSIDSAPGFWMKYWNHDDHDHGHDYHEEKWGGYLSEKLEVYAVGDGQSERWCALLENYSDKSWFVAWLSRLVMRSWHSGCPGSRTWWEGRTRPIPYVVMLGTEREENLIYILSVLSVRASPLWVALWAHGGDVSRSGRTR